MAGHTPGPWPQPTRSGDGKFISIEKWGPDRDNWHRLAVEIDSDDCDSDTAMANARLIAAAPDLLAALQATRSYCVPGMDFAGEYWRELQAKADAAIARALHG
jgi:hypothetical protein